MEGWAGAVAGGDGIRPLNWDSVGSILHRGGTIIGTARSKEFRTREGMLSAAANLLEHGIDRLVVIGGDGSLTGTNEFRKAWPSLLAELMETGRITPEVAAAHSQLMIAGLVGSIDNDLVGTDMTIGADSALHRIMEAIDSLSSTAASHQRTFVIEVMGRHCGYLALMSAVAGGCDYVFVPELPPADGWEEDMCNKLQAGRAAGRRDSLVIVAEGAQDREGNRITAADVCDVLEERLGEDARVTILGHVQRGGRPSAYDRWMSTLLGYAAAQEVLRATPESEPHIIGVRHNRIAHLPLMESVENTRAVATYIKDGDYEAAVEARGASFAQMLQIFENMSPPPVQSSHNEASPVKNKRVAILHAGGLAPGMNTAARAAVRLGIDHGLTMLGIEGGFPGLLDGAVKELSWADVEGWVGEGGAALGTHRDYPTIEQLYSIGRSLESNHIDGLIVIGGFNAYLGAHTLIKERDRYPAFNIPIVCVPASIDNNLPGSELSIGADTAVNSTVSTLDAIKLSASASKRCFVAEVMGRRCGYLTLMSGLATGAEKVYLPEHDATLDEIASATSDMVKSFRDGRRLYLVLRNEAACGLYSTKLLADVFAQESNGLYDVRESVIGHVQQGGNPTAFDRLMATRLVTNAMQVLVDELVAGTARGHYVGLVNGEFRDSPLAHMNDELDLVNRRPRDQWWLRLEHVIPVVSQDEVAIDKSKLPPL